MSTDTEMVSSRLLANEGSHHENFKILCLEITRMRSGIANPEIGPLPKISNYKPPPAKRPLVKQNKTNLAHIHTLKTHQHKHSCRQTVTDRSDLG